MSISTSKNRNVLYLFCIYSIFKILQPELFRNLLYFYIYSIFKFLQPELKRNIYIYFLHSFVYIQDLSTSKNRNLSYVFTYFYIYSIFKILQPELNRNLLYFYIYSIFKFFTTRVEEKYLYIFSTHFCIYSRFVNFYVCRLFFCMFVDFILYVFTYFYIYSILKFLQPALKRNLLYFLQISTNLN